MSEYACSHRIELLLRQFDRETQNLLRSLLVALRVVFGSEADDWVKWLSSCGDGSIEFEIKRLKHLLDVAMKPEFAEQVESLPIKDRKVLEKGALALAEIMG